MSIRSIIPAAIVILALAAPPAGAQTTTAEIIQQNAEQLLIGADVEIGGTSIASAHIIPELYQRRSFQPAWTSAARVNELINLIGRAAEEGLDPEDYNYAELGELAESFRENPYDPVLAGSFDILLTDSLTRYGYHLLFGKVSPENLDQNWNWSRNVEGRDPATMIQNAIDSDSLETYIHRTLNRGIVYYRLKDALAEYRALQARGGWPRVAPGSTLRPDMEDERAPVIRRRLVVTGDLDAAAESQSLLYDQALQEGVMKFQERHNLDADGVIGPQTLAAMNVSVDDRIDQIRVNLERTRWVFRDVEDDFVLTNIAAFKVYLVRDRKVAWSAKAQVGRYYRQTPVFKASMKYMQFNPTWTVPPGILSKDILPRLKRDPGYLAEKNMDVVNRDGKVVDPATIDFSKYTGRNFPYQLVQRPGSTNALGRVKFIFPNHHFVFLHDTPSKTLFDRTERTFSSGCIRIENPFELAELLLNDPEQWNQESIQTVLDSEKPKTVFLKKPLTVMLLYGTVGVEEDGVIGFYNDVYKRDARILKALAGDFEYHIPEGGPEYLRQ